MPAFWDNLCHDILALLQRALRLSVASLKILASTVLTYTLGEGTGFVLDVVMVFTLSSPVVGGLSALVSGITLGCAAEFLTVTAASEML